MEFIRFDENQKAWYFGKCKITINTHSKQLIVEPIEEDLKMMSASFYQNIIPQNNVLFVFIDNKKRMMDFILIFPKQESCRKVCEIIQKYEQQKSISNSHDKNILFEKYLTPFLKSLKNDEKLISQFGNDTSFDILLNIFPLQTHEEENQKVIPEALKDVDEICQNMEIETRILAPSKKTRPDTNYINDNHSSNNVIISEVDKNLELSLTEKSDIEEENILSPPPKKRRKRKCIQQKRRIILPKDKIVEKPNYKLIFFKQYVITRSRLIIFPNFTNQKLCYEYLWNNYYKCYECAVCSKLKPRVYVNAKAIKQDDKKEEYILLGKNNHVCQMREYNPEKFKDSEIIYKPNYEMFEYSKKGKSKRLLIIFTSETKEFCYYFNFSVSMFYCIKCATKRFKYNVAVCKDDNETEYLSLTTKKHVCEPIEYIPGEFKDLNLRFRTTVAPENSQTKQTPKKLRKTEFFKSFKNDRIETIEPQEKNISPRKMIEFKKIKKPFYKIIKRRFGGKLFDKLIIFDENNKDLCYEYGLADEYFYCLECRQAHNQHRVSAKLVKEGDDEEYIEMVGGTKHLCTPRIYIPDNLASRIIRKPNYAIHQHANNKDSKTLVVYNLNDPNRCYNYLYNNGKKLFSRIACQKLHKGVSAKLIQETKNENGENCFIELSIHPHSCESEPNERELNPSEYKFEK